ncbi:MAG: LysE family translocator [Anaerolineales bacterium]|jgi:threonine/homoserine/homoserine lactone efflux protein
MPELSQIHFFAGASLALLLMPGPAVLYILARSVNQGRSAGLVSVLGIETANFCHAAAAALGLSAILLSSALAFNVVKYLGAAYLIYLGIHKLAAHQEDHPQEIIHPQSLRRIYSQGVIVNLLNPKVALFFFAFLPQFVDLSHGNPTTQILALGALFVGMAIITDSCYALLGSSIARRLKGNQRFAKGQRYFSGLIYLGLGISTALSGVHKQ